MGGYFKVHRSLFDNPLWTSEPFTKAQAWIDLFGKANHDDGFFFKRGIKIDVKRGQTGRSELTLSKDWKWSRGKVRRFLKWLEINEMIERKQDNKTTIITICNYDRFQPLKNQDGTTNSTPSSTTNGHQTDINNKNNKNKKNKKTNITKPDSVSEQTWKDFLTHRKNKKSPLTQTALDRIINQAQKANWKLEDALAEMINRGWTGFNSDWVNKNSDNGRSKAQQKIEETNRILNGDF